MVLRVLPVEGSWEGPVFGRLGVLTEDDNGRLQCHICGEFYSKVGSHASQKHGVRPDEYKAIFGFYQRDSLASKDIRDACRARSQELLRLAKEEYLTTHPHPFSLMTSAQLSALGSLPKPRKDRARKSANARKHLPEILKNNLTAAGLNKKDTCPRGHLKRLMANGRRTKCFICESERRRRKRLQREDHAS